MSKVRKITTLTIGQGINVMVNFLFMPYMARVLDYKDYGSYGQVLLIVSFVGAVLTVGLPQILYVYLNEKGRDEKLVLTTNVLGAFSLGGLGTLFLLLTAPFLAVWINNPSIKDLIFFYAFSILFSIPNQSINSFFIFSDKVKTSVVLIIFINLLKVLLVVYAIQIYQSVQLALLGIVISQLVQFIVGIYLTRKKIIFKIDKTLFFKQIKKGFPLGLTGLLGAAILYTDGIMVSKLKGVEAYAIYRNGAIEVPFIATIYGSIATIILPEVAKLFSENKLKDILVLKRKVIMNTMMFTYPILIFLLFNSTSLITTYLGEKYSASSIIFLVFNLTLLVRINDYSDILISANKSRYILYFYAISLLINVVLNYVLIHLIGSVGAAISTVISIFFLAFLQLKMSLTIIKAKFLELIIAKDVFLLLLSSLTLAFLLNLFLSYWFEKELKLIIFGLLFFSTIYFFLFKMRLFSREILLKLMPSKMTNFIQKL